MIGFRRIVLASTLLWLCTAGFQAHSQNLTDGWSARKTQKRASARHEETFRHKINFFFGNYWNTSRSKLKKFRVAAKNYRASGKMTKAKKLLAGKDFQKIQFKDLEERAYIAHEYGLFSIDYLADKPIESLPMEERVFVQTAVYRSLSGPVSNKIGYKNLMSNEPGQQKLRQLMEEIIDEYKSKSGAKIAFTAKLAPRVARKQAGLEGISDQQKIYSFCQAATKTFDKYVAKNKVDGKAPEKANLVQMSCEDKRLRVYQLIANTSK